jgi:peptidoglycan/LPS O-acetylase OafA/YrhL
VWLGLVSYGIYLWHEEALDIYLKRYHRVAFQSGSAWHWTWPLGIQPSFGEMVVFMLALTIPIAAASYYLVERPALRLKGRLRFRSRP